jgi:serine/threonine-protein kinase RsbW
VSETIHTLTIPSSTRFLHDVRQFVEKHALEAGFSQPTVNAIKIAVDEACTNIIKHSYDGDTSQEVEVEVAITEGHLQVCLRDEGEPFDPSTYQEPDLTRLTERRRPGGLGVHLMRRCMDDVRYRTDQGFNEVCLTKRLNSDSTV